MDNENISENRYEEQAVEQQEDEQIQAESNLHLKCCEENEVLQARLATLSRQYQSLTHDFENYKRRTEEAREKDKELACEQIIVALLPLADDFERAIRYAVDNQVPRNLVEGDMAILKRLFEIMAKQGVKMIPADGAFDETRHKAVSQIKQENIEPGQIIEVVQNGYELAGKIIRPASVVVSG